MSADAYKMPIEKKAPEANDVAVAPKRQLWRPTYQVCKTLPAGSLEVIATYYNLEEAEKKVNTLREYSHEEYYVYDLLAQKVVALSGSESSQSADS